MLTVTLAILAGGASSRMGSPKSHLTFRGRPILQHVLEQLAWDGPTLLITAPSREHPPGADLFARELVDPLPDMGPLGGMLTALENATTEWTIFLPVDMPFIRPEHARFLIEQRHDLGTFLQRGPDGPIEPFPCILHRESIGVIQSHFNSADQSVKSLRREKGFHTVPAPLSWDASVWTNLNYPADVDHVSTQRPIQRYRAGSAIESATDELAEESPLEIRVKNRALSVTMRTPGHDHELAAGFLLGEGLIRTASDVLSIDMCSQSPQGNVINVALHPRVNIDFAKLTRHTYASSSCGLCGKASIDAIHEHFEPVNSHVTVDIETILSLPAKLRTAQSKFDRTGGLHAAGLFDLHGTLIVSREDVGRHNAVDKVIGYGLLNGLFPLDQHVLLVSGRASFEILQKSLAGRIPIICAISAPSTLAVDFAKESNQTLVGFLRDGRMNIYSHASRITF